MPDVRIGISGWTYAPWRGVFYPEDLPQKRELAYASEQFNSIEVNGTFYGMQRPTAFQTWFDQTPDSFLFSIKGSRYITHLRRLKEVETPLANFLASGVLLLKHKLGPILWQFPPMMKFDKDRFARFFELLPRDTKQAAKLARRHDDWMKGRTYTKCDENRPMRHCVEIRHESFITPAFVKLLRQHDIGLVVADTAGKWPLMEDVTSDFIYIRLHGDEQIYVSGYTDEALDRWAKKIAAWRDGDELADTQRVGPRAAKRKTGRDIYVYFDNDVKVRAPFDAAGLARRLDLREQPLTWHSASQKVHEPPRDHWPAMRRTRVSPTRPKRGKQTRAKATAD